MSVKRVLLIESGHFIGGVISNLFQQRQQMEVIETAPGNAAELLRAIRLYNPHIVVLDDTVRGDFLALLLDCMQETEGLSVVVMSTNDNNVSLYQKQLIPVHKTEDFFALL